MAINPIHYAMVQRTNDVSALKHNEDAKPLQAQQNTVCLFSALCKTAECVPHSSILKKAAKLDLLC